MTRLKYLYWFVVALHLGLLWWLPFFPSQDGACHVYNTLILRDLMNDGATYGQFFDLRLGFVPNLGGSVLLYGLMSLFPPLVAEKILLSIFFLLLAAFIPLLIQLLGNEAFPGSFAVFPLFFSRLTLPGFYSLMLGQVLLLCGLWLFWRMRANPLWQRFLVSNVFAGLLFCCHFLPFVWYLIAIGCALLAAWGNRREFINKLSGTAALLALPAVAVGSAVWTLLHKDSVSETSLLTGLNFKLNLNTLLDLLMLSQFTFSPRQVYSGLLLGLLLISFLWRRETWQQGQTSHPHAAAFRWLLLTWSSVLVLMLCVPDRIWEVSLIKLRFVPMLVLLLLPLLPLAKMPPALPRLFLAGTLIAATFNGVLVWQTAQQVARFVAPVPVPAVAGKFVAGYRGTKSTLRIDPLLHATEYFCALHRCLDAGNYQAYTNHFFVRFKPGRALPSTRELESAPTKIAWEQYPEVAYLLGWEFDPQEKARLAPTFTMLNEKSALSLWRRSQTAPTTASATTAALTQ